MKVVGLLFILFAFALTQDPPVWPSQFSMWFDETAKIITTGNTKGVIYYDEPSNKQAVERDSGRHDRYCGSVYKNVDTPCRHIVTGNKRFLDFPEKKYCCFCCDSTHGCGILAKDWLKKGGAVYNGTEQLDAQGPYDKWEIKGGQENFYWSKQDTLKTPKRLLQLPEDDMNYTRIDVGAVDQSKFSVPEYCTSQCGLTTICAFLRDEVTQ